MICLRCGRKLTSKKSLEKGMGPICVRKTKLEDAKDNADHAAELEEFEGQINFIDEIRKCS